MRAWIKRRRAALVDRTPATLARAWRLAKLADGTLSVQPPGPTLGPGELAEMISHIAARPDVDQLRRVTMDLGQVRCLGPQPTIVVALFVKLARLLAGRFRLIGPSGETASVLAFYGQTLTLTRLFAGVG